MGKAGFRALCVCWYLNALAGSVNLVGVGFFTCMYCVTIPSKVTYYVNLKWHLFFCFTYMQYVNGIGLTLFFWCLGGLSLTAYIIAHFNGGWIDRNWGLENLKLHNLLCHYWVIMLFFWIGDIVAAWVVARLLFTTCAFQHFIVVSLHFFRAACNLVAPYSPSYCLSICSSALHTLLPALLFHPRHSCGCAKLSSPLCIFF